MSEIYEVLVGKPCEEPDLRIRVEKSPGASDEQYYDDAIESAAMIKGRFGRMVSGRQVNVVRAGGLQPGQIPENL